MIVIKTILIVIVLLFLIAQCFYFPIVVLVKLILDQYISKQELLDDLFPYMRIIRKYKDLK